MKNTLLQSIISDTTTLIILGKLKKYDLLSNLFSKIYIPPEVMNEVSKKSDGVAEQIKELDLFEVKNISDMQLFHFLDGVLDKGESEAIVLANELNMILLIDEKKGRSIAKDMGLEIIGLLGVLILNVKKKYISQEEAKSILENIKALQFRVSKKLEESFLMAIG
ncbi:MAG TPA: DUF3368 domain-containing protein [Campylobacterales bacterium]|nr:DUF3368 domain-containing protein [Campylobacterales bacterium]